MFDFTINDNPNADEWHSGKGARLSLSKKKKKKKKASDSQHWISFSTRVRSPVLPTNFMLQVSGELNCSDILKAKYHHLRSDAEIAKL